VRGKSGRRERRKEEEGKRMRNGGEGGKGRGPAPKYFGPKPLLHDQSVCPYLRESVCHKLKFYHKKLSYFRGRARRSDSVETSSADLLLHEKSRLNKLAVGHLKWRC